MNKTIQHNYSRAHKHLSRRIITKFIYSVLNNTYYLRELKGDCRECLFARVHFAQSILSGVYHTVYTFTFIE